MSGSMLARASANLRVTNKASACLYAFDVSDLALRGEDIEPTDEPRSWEVGNAPLIESMRVVVDPFIVLPESVDA